MKLGRLKIRGIREIIGVGVKDRVVNKGSEAGVEKFSYSKERK